VAEASKGQTPRILLVLPNAASGTLPFHFFVFLQLRAEKPQSRLLSAKFFAK